ncbi:MAG: ribosome recycling factor [Victivallales bacterium]|nr:ribosome recycling factor [Victivallales bacterium]
MGKKDKDKDKNKKGGSAPAAASAAMAAPAISYNFNDSTKITETATAAMNQALAFMEKDFASFRTGKASPAMLDGVMVEAYGSQMRLKDMAAVTAPEPLLLVIRPFDINSIKNIEKAIIASNIGISPVSDGRVVRLPVPELSAERRAELSKNIKKRSEDAKIQVRNVRRDANDAIKKFEKDSSFTEDEADALTEKIQKLTDQTVDKIQKATDTKIAELEHI